MPSAATDIGRNTPTAPAQSGTVTLTTTALVPSGGKVFAFVGWFSATATLSSITFGGTAGTVEQQLANGSNHAALCWFDAASGLANASTVTGTFSDATPDSRHISAYYATGMATGTPAVKASATTGTTAWSSGTITTNAGGFLAGYNYGAGASATNTATGDNTEIHDFGIATDSESASVYAFGTGGAMAATGTWTAAESNAAMAAVWAPTDAATTKTLYMTSSLAGTAHQEMAQAAPAAALATPAVGWITATNGASLFAHFDAQSEVARTLFTAGAKPATTINTGAGAGNGWRSTSPYTGTFQAGTWTLTMTVRSVTAAYTGRFRIRGRLYRATGADGTGASDIAGGADVVSATTTANLSTTVDTALTLSFTVGQTTFASEYVFVTLAAETVTAGGGTTQDANLRVGSGLSQLVTTTFPFAGAAAVIPNLLMSPMIPN